MDRETIDLLVGGEPFELNGSTVTIGSVDIQLDGAKWFDPVLKDALPRSPRGDYRERTVNHLVRDAVADKGAIKEEVLIGPPDGGEFSNDPTIEDPDMRRRFGEVLHDQYVVETAKRTKFLFPFHTDLPGNYKFKGNYKMFNGLILAFMCQPGPDGDEFNIELLESFYDLFNDNTDLTLLDRQVLRLAREAAGEADGVGRHEARAEQLIAEHREGLGGVGVLLPEVHEMFQRDLRTALEMRSLGRKDRVAAVLNVFYLHLALYFWRLGYVLEEQASAFLEFLDNPNAATLGRVERAADPTIAGSVFRAKLKFRVQSSRSRTYRLDEPAMESYRDIDARRLHVLPLNLSLLRLSRILTGKAGTTATFADAARSLMKSTDRRKQFDAGCRVVAACIARDRLGDEARADIERMARAPGEPGFLAVREALTKGWRREFRRSSRDITAQLMKRGGKGIVANRGPSLLYFELGQELLLLLAKLVTRGEALPYGTFLERLADYGLEPQTSAEEDELADVLRSLQLLEKYSDAGESMYVKHFL